MNPAQSEVVKAHALVGLNQLLLGGTPSGQAAGAAFAARLAPSPAFQKCESRAGLVVNLANLLGQPAVATRVAAAGAEPGACQVDCGLCNSLTTPNRAATLPCVMLVFLTQGSMQRVLPAQDQLQDMACVWRVRTINHSGQHGCAQVSRSVCVSAEALAAMGDSNAANWAVVQKGVPHLIQMLRAPDLAQVDAAVRLPHQPSQPCTSTAEAHPCMRRWVQKHWV